MGYADIAAATAMQDARQRLGRIENALNDEPELRRTRILPRGVASATRLVSNVTSKDWATSASSRLGLNTISLRLRNTFDTREVDNDDDNEETEYAATHTAPW